MKIRRTVAAIAATLLPVVTAGTGQAAGAAAYECTANHMCAYAWPGGDGERIELLFAVEDLGTWKGGVLNDQISSGWNRSPFPFCFYVDSQYRGERYQSAPGSSGWFPHNDAYSSIKRGSC
ncbi:peptidase inhibitor family I36 protein [Saccharothrix algeriensis]|uniref:Peptidase inhibitor family I36 protein n=1 Tax=Saccharothrix algeriensis TaxID=173560 RepID=A0A8T8HZB0_9PSEU|nr:peptidase inhibitor family I36 protein [Saccharothrix algeriensis]MBM7809684.1 hypothetical protein [Saccharothrix algeriensis]QTR03983.1 peptidase inhibitor family I36 protein [Saccharothrix algeriensis]